MYGFFKNKRIVLYDTLIQQVRRPFFLDSVYINLLSHLEFILMKTLYIFPMSILFC
jgi:hypothetical protein